MKTQMLALSLLLLPALAAAQTRADSMAHFAWAQGDTDASALTYLLVVDGLPAITINHTCAPTAEGDHDCTAPLPPLSKGLHLLSLVARATVDGVPYDSRPSDDLTVARIPDPPSAFVVIVGGE